MKKNLPILEAAEDILCIAKAVKTGEDVDTLVDRVIFSLITDAEDAKLHLYCMAKELIFRERLCMDLGPEADEIADIFEQILKTLEKKTRENRV